MAEPVEFGDYDLVQKLGVSSISTVWRAVSKSTGKTVALKMLNPQSARDRTIRQRFEQAAKALIAMNHPNIVAAFDAAEEDATPYVILEFMEGGSLDQRMKPPDPSTLRVLKEARALQIALDCCRALEYLHGRQIIHRDIKPSNVLFATDGTAKLSDFVFARQEVLAQNLTVTGIAIGSPGYMSPEQVKMQGLGPKADLYCLGCMMFHTLTGRLPFEAESPFESMKRRLTEEMPSVDSLRDGLSLETRKIVRRLSLRDPDQRYATATEARFAIEAALAALKG